jgi:hypothetical protein
MTLMQRMKLTNARSDLILIKHKTVPAVAYIELPAKVVYGLRTVGTNAANILPGFACNEKYPKYPIEVGCILTREYYGWGWPSYSNSHYGLPSTYRYWSVFYENGDVYKQIERNFEFIEQVWRKNITRSTA